MDDTWAFPKVDEERCTACAACVLACQNGALVSSEYVPVLAHPEMCDGCGVCEDVCPEGAISCPFEIVWDVEDDAKLSAEGGSRG